MEILQITTSLPADTLTVNSGEDSLALISLIFQGGYMMIPIFLLSFVAVYVFVERIRTIGRAAKTPSGFMDNIKKLVTEGDLSGAKLISQQSDTPIGRMIGKGYDWLPRNSYRNDTCIYVYRPGRRCSKSETVISRNL